MADLSEATYSPGAWVAVTAAAGWLLVDLPPEDPVVRRCWKLLSEDAGVDAVLDALAAGGVGSSPSFALVGVSRGVGRVVVRNPARVSIRAEAQDEEFVSAQPGITWRDEVLTVAPDGVSLWSSQTSTLSVELPMGAGVTTAAVVHVTAGVPATAASKPVQRPAPPTKPAMPHPDAEVPEVLPQPLPPPAASPAPPPAVSDTPDLEPGRPASDEPVPSYDFLFGATQRPVPPPEPRSPALTEQTAGWDTQPPVAVDADDAGLIQGVPWAVGADEAPGPDPSTDRLSPGSDDARSVAERTVNRALVRAAEAGIGPTVLAGYCPDGHLSPPHAAVCRICRAPMAAQDAFEIARPPLGVLRLSTDDVVALDRNVLLGRSPDVPEGDDRPNVLRLRSPENDISRNHAEIVLDGWNVYVRDLGSTNGTVVQLPGQPPLRLREHALQLLEPASTITLADEVSLTFEVTP